MVEKSEEDFLRVIGARSTREILQFSAGHETFHYKELDEFVNTDTLNHRLRDFLRYSLVEHHIKRGEGRGEWYTMTDRGRKVLNSIEKCVSLVENEPEFLKFIGSKGAKEVLQFLRERGEAQYKDFRVNISIPTLNNRLSRLLDFYLVDHYFQKKPQRKEWYEITEKGIEMSKYLEDLVKLADE